MTKYWFKPKKFGWGFVPVTKEGWLATVGLFIAVLINAKLNNIFSPIVTFNEGLTFLFITFLIIVVFSILFKDKVEGGLKWRWG